MDVAQVIEAVADGRDPVAGQLGDVEALLRGVFHVQAEMVFAKNGGLQETAVPWYRGVILDRGQTDGVVPNGLADLGGKLSIGEIQTEVNILPETKRDWT